MTNTAPTPAPSAAEPEPAPPPGALDFVAIYQAHFDDVTRWLRALGAPEAELDDLAQEVFLVVRRKLPEFHGHNLKGWLYKMATYMASDHRRRGWFKHLFRAPRGEALEKLRSVSTPESDYTSRETQQQVRALLGRMSEAKRTAFWLFEIEGYSGEEIASLQGIPVATVWTRLHHARKEFIALAGDARLVGDTTSAGGT